MNFLRVSWRKRSRRFALRDLSFSCFKWVFIEVPQFKQNSPVLKSFWLRDQKVCQRNLHQAQLIEMTLEQAITFAALYLWTNNQINCAFLSNSVILRIWDIKYNHIKKFNSYVLTLWWRRPDWAGVYRITASVIKGF